MAWSCQVRRETVANGTDRQVHQAGSPESLGSEETIQLW